MKYLCEKVNEFRDFEDFEAIGFDMDGTLYYEEIFIKQVYQQISRYISNFSSVCNEDVYEFMLLRWNEKGSSYPFIFSETLEKYNIEANEDIIKGCLKIYREFIPELSLIEEVKNLLNRLKANFKLFLITDGNYSLQKAKFNALGLNRWFSEENVVFTGVLGKDYYKPNVKSKNYVECLKIVRKPVLYIGDREVDKQFASNANFYFLNVRDFNHFWDVNNS